MSDECNTMWRDIEDFHDQFRLPHPKEPKIVEEEIMAFRMKFLKEELEEFQEAVEGNDLVGAFDALIDLVYVAMGTAKLMGLPFDKGWAVVHQANMKKKRAITNEESKRGSSFDVVKPERWVAPNKALEIIVLAENDPYISVNV